MEANPSVSRNFRIKKYFLIQVLFKNYLEIAFEMGCVLIKANIRQRKCSFDIC